MKKSVDMGVVISFKISIFALVNTTVANDAQGGAWL